jgi:hypothetical protein
MALELQQLGLNVLVGVPADEQGVVVRPAPAREKLCNFLCPL